tara:strand:+ start:134 stop:508 length:375 start_codon:yes stop_codon:yes gene_type:complete
MSKEYDLKITYKDGRRAVYFENNTTDFVEVVFALNGDEITRMVPAARARGYCYPPLYRKEITKTRSGETLPLGQHGKLQAFVYSGKGRYKPQNLDVPAFIRKKMKAAFFERIGNAPSAVLQVQY